MSRSSSAVARSRDELERPEPVANIASLGRLVSSQRLLALAGATAALFCLGVGLSFSRGGHPFCSPACLDARLEQLVGPNGELPPAKFDAARELVRRQIEYSPFDDSAWLRLTAIQTAAHGGRVGPAASNALEASYRYAPIHAEVAQWRLRFVFDHWDEVNEQIRNAARQELSTLAVATENLPTLRAIGPTIRNPSGRLAFALLLYTP